MNKINSKVFIVFILAILMVLMMPAAAFADEGDPIGFALDENISDEDIISFAKVVYLTIQRNQEQPKGCSFYVIEAEKLLNT